MEGKSTNDNAGKDGSICIETPQVANIYKNMGDDESNNIETPPVANDHKSTTRKISGEKYREYIELNVISEAINYEIQLNNPPVPNTNGMASNPCDQMETNTEEDEHTYVDMCEDMNTYIEMLEIDNNSANRLKIDDNTCTNVTVLPQNNQGSSITCLKPHKLVAVCIVVLVLAVGSGCAIYFLDQSPTEMPNNSKPTAAAEYEPTVGTESWSTDASFALSMNQMLRELGVGG